MAIVKIRFNKNARQTLFYAFDERSPGDPVDAVDCPADRDGSAREFELVRELHNFKGGNEAAHIVQSWSPKESEELTREEANTMGKKLVEDYFRGHPFVVVTHSHGAHLHNHIVVSTVHRETGRRIPNKKLHLYRLREINDQVCRERGLSVLEPDAIGRNRGLSDKAQRIAMYRGGSYMLDMRQKIDFARAYSTNYDAFAATLGELGVAARVENKNISYFYDGQQRGKRGSKIGRLYDKAGLEAAFRSNDERRALGASGQLLLDQGRGSGGGKTDYSRFTPIPRGVHPRDVFAGRDVPGALVPISELRRARSASLFGYLRANGIEITTNDKGHTVLKGREHVAVTDAGWTNARNRTGGSLIEFAAHHRQTTLLQSVAAINGNPALLDLERTHGEVKRKFTSFYVPRPENLEPSERTENVRRFLASFNIRPETATPLQQRGQVQAMGRGWVRLFAHGEREGYADYIEDLPPTWSRQPGQRAKKPFYSHSGQGPRAVVFTDPLSYMGKRGRDSFADRARRDGILALMEPDERVVDDFLRANPHTKAVHVVTRGRKPSQRDLDFFGVLQKRFAPHGLHVELVPHDRVLGREGPGPEL